MKDLSKYYTKSEINTELVPDPQDPNAIEETAKILDFIDTALHRILTIDRGLLETGLLKNQELRKRVISDIDSAVAKWGNARLSPMGSIYKSPENNKEDIETAERTLGSFLDYFENIENDDDDAENPDEFDK